MCKIIQIKFLFQISMIILKWLVALRTIILVTIKNFTLSTKSHKVITHYTFSKDIWLERLAFNSNNYPSAYLIIPYIYRLIN